MCEEGNASAARRIRQSQVNMRPESLCIIIIIVVVLVVNDYSALQHVGIIFLFARKYGS